MLDFSKRKKKYFDVVLHDGTALQVPTPTMDIYSAMSEVYESGDKVTGDELGAVVEKVLAANRQGVKITRKHMEKFDLDDMKELLTGYVSFVQSALSDPN